MDDQRIDRKGWWPGPELSCLLALFLCTCGPILLYLLGHLLAYLLGLPRWFPALFGLLCMFAIIYAWRRIVERELSGK
jgi:hypothetical protein